MSEGILISFSLYAETLERYFETARDVKSARSQEVRRLTVIIFHSFVSCNLANHDLLVKRGLLKPVPY